MAEKRHESANAGAAKNNTVADEMIPSHIVCSTLRVKSFLKKLFAPRYVPRLGDVVSNACALGCEFTRVERLSSAPLKS